jgi:hypothetical protein
MSNGELVVGTAVFLVAIVFVMSHRFVSRRLAPSGVPAATVVDGAPRWLAGRSRARMIRRADAFQRVAIAFGLTSVIVMIACLVGMIVLGVIANA